ncbi:MAG: HpcH/HpaI aldolase/citrate lyase family protein [bacterium]|nr:HpcH/HpaI aldolase/citrate lyase family protein [bacterium]
MNRYNTTLESDKDRLFSYSVGALLYSPANNKTICDSVIDGKFGTTYSLALCLEDSISDYAVESAELEVVETLKRLFLETKKRQFFLPKIFIRVRNAQQVKRISEQLEDSIEILTGFIFPKFSIGVMEEYIEQILEINRHTKQKLYMMPIIESQDIVTLSTRWKVLEQIKERLLPIREYVLNIRIGGNDLCKEFGIRRQMDQTIYDIGCVRNILADIVTCFGRDFVISGPVWEYFNSANQDWKKGMQREIALDMVNGCIGKTVIHPKQIAVVNEALRVKEHDYLDAIKIIELFNDQVRYVEKSVIGERMNECKTHLRWAEKVLILAELYGVEKTCRNNKEIIPVMI